MRLFPGFIIMFLITTAVLAQEPEKAYTYPYKWYAISSFAVGATALLTAGVLNGVAPKQHDIAEDRYRTFKGAADDIYARNHWTSYRDAKKRYDDIQVTGYVMFGLAGAAGITGAILFLFKKEVPENAAFYINPLALQAGMSIRY